MCRFEQCTFVHTRSHFYLYRIISATKENSDNNDDDDGNVGDDGDDDFSLTPNLKQPSNSWVTKSTKYQLDGNKFSKVCEHNFLHHDLSTLSKHIVYSPSHSRFLYAFHFYKMKPDNNSNTLRAYLTQLGDVKYETQLKTIWLVFQLLIVFVIGCCSIFAHFPLHKCKSVKSQASRRTYAILEQQ